MSPEERIRRQLIVRQAEGYLELGMPRHALDTLCRWRDAESQSGRALYLRGESLRMLERYNEALIWFDRAAELLPEDIHLCLAQGWCHKRTGQIHLAIESLCRARAIDPGDPLVHYNLACYWSLARNKRLALEHLARALEKNAHFREHAHEESDFDFVRDDPRFQSLTSVIV